MERNAFYLNLNSRFFRSFSPPAIQRRRSVRHLLVCLNAAPTTCPMLPLPCERQHQRLIILELFAKQRSACHFKRRFSSHCSSMCTCGKQMEQMLTSGSDRRTKMLQNRGRCGVRARRRESSQNESTCFRFGWGVRLRRGCGTGAA